MNSNPITDAIGTLKLAGMHMHNHTAVAAEVVQGAADECIQRLQRIDARQLQLLAIHEALARVLPAGWLPYVTVTGELERPYGAAIANETGYLFCHYKGKSIEGLVAMVCARIGLGRVDLE